MSIGQLMRLLFGPLAVVFVIVSYLQIPKGDPRFEKPIDLQYVPLEKTTSVHLASAGQYTVFCVVPLGVAPSSSSYDVDEVINTGGLGRDFLDWKPSSIHLQNSSGIDIGQGPSTESDSYHIWKSADPESWQCGLAMSLFTIDQPETINAQILARDQAPKNGRFAIGRIQHLNYTTAHIVICLSMLFVGVLLCAWILLKVSAWSRLVDKFEHPINLAKMRNAGENAFVGVMPSSFIPGQKLLFKETESGIDLCLTGLARMLGFGSISIPWSEFGSAKKIRDRLQLKLKSPETSISISSSLLRAAHLKVVQENDESQEDSATEIAIETPEVPQPEQIATSRSMQLSLVVFLIGMGAIVSKFWIFDTLEQARIKVAKLYIWDFAVPFAYILLLQGLLLLIATFKQQPSDTDISSTRRRSTWLQWLLVLPIIPLWLWFRCELTRLGYGF